MLQMCRFVKPILSMVPPDPTTLAAARAAEADVPGPPLPGPERRRQVQPGAAHDHERHGLPRSMVRDGRAQGHDVGFGNHRHVPRRAFARARPTCCCTTTWARSTARFAHGDLRAAGLAPFRMPSPMRRASLASRSKRRPASPRSSCAAEGLSASQRPPATNTTPTSFLPASIPTSRS